MDGEKTGGSPGRIGRFGSAASGNTGCGTCVSLRGAGTRQQGRRGGAFLNEPSGGARAQKSHGRKRRRKIPPALAGFAILYHAKSGAKERSLRAAELLKGFCGAMRRFLQKGAAARANRVQRSARSGRHGAFAPVGGLRALGVPPAAAFLRKFSGKRRSWRWSVLPYGLFGNVFAFL